jgi:hypothetical protein
VALADGAKLGPLIASVARRSAAHPALAAGRAEVVREAAATDLLAERTIRRVRAALEGASCRHLFLKGACFRETLYALPWMRSMVDVDVLVHPGDGLRGFLALRAAGFAPAPVERREPVTDLLFRQVVFRPPDRGPALEAHLDLYDDGAGWRIDPDGLFARAATTPSGLPTLSWEDHVLHASVHLARLAFRQPLRHVLDVHRVFATRPPDGPALAQRAREWGCSRALGLTLEAARFAFGTEVDPALLRETATRGPLGAAVRALVEPGRSDPAPVRSRRAARFAATLLLMDRAASRTAFVADKACTWTLDAAARAVLEGRSCP